MPRHDGFIRRDLREKIEKELAPDEEILWMGAPTPRFFTPASSSVFVFALIWTTIAVSISWGFARAGNGETSDPSSWPQQIMLLMPAFFVLIGVGLLSTPFWMYWKARRSIYAVTDRRAIIVEKGLATTIRSYYPDKFGNVYRRERRNGLGDVIIERPWTAPANGSGQAQFQEIGFMNIRNPKEVEDMLRKIAASGKE